MQKFAPPSGHLYNDMSNDNDDNDANTVTTTAAAETMLKRHTL